MKNKISFKLFCAVIWKGIKQALGYIGRLFGYKEGTGFGKVVWRVFAASCTVVVFLYACALVTAVCKEIVYARWIGPAVCNLFWEEKHISNDIVLQWQYRRSANKRIYNETTGEVLLKKVDWVVTSADKDSLAVFAKDGKRGYLDRFTGEVVIPPVFTRAWVFSEGLAAVEKDGKLVFIDHSGKVVIDNDLKVYFNRPRYGFRNGYCIVHDIVTRKQGLINRQGEWVLDAEYDEITNDSGFWLVRKANKYGLFSAEMDTLFTVDKPHIEIDNGKIKVGYADHTARLYDFEGKILNDFCIDSVFTMIYHTDEIITAATVQDSCSRDRNSIVVPAVASCRKYSVNQSWRKGDTSRYEGLLDRSGRRITPPLYTSIEAIGKDLYLCQPDGIILDSHGRIIMQ